jgi:hypothetical protein
MMQDSLNPIPAEAQITIAALPMTINPAAERLLPPLAALEQLEAR